MNHTEFEIINNLEPIVYNSKVDNIKKLYLTPLNIRGFFTDIEVIDSLLICGNFKSSQLVDIYSLEKEELIGSFINRGILKGEGLSVADIKKDIHSNSLVWIYDITLGKLLKINLSKLNQKNIEPIDQEIVLSENLKNVISPEILNDSSFIATSYTLDDNRYFYFKEGSIIKKNGNLPLIKNEKKLNTPKNSKFSNKAIVFKAIALKNRNKVAIFYNKTDRAEFYSNDKLVSVISMKNYEFNPSLKVEKFSDGNSVLDGEKTRYAYLSVSKTNEYIYCLFSGGHNAETSSNKIFVFDWSGNFISEIELNKKVCKISVDSKKNILYCYDDVNKNIYSAKIDLDK
ncbi:MAG: BF3164 family lipoprotein [Cruoricaptor ignavus]|nr:BF3164 family lipoprotein [Cruoricaptor ignavus]